MRRGRSAMGKRRADNTVRVQTQRPESRALGERESAVRMRTQRPEEKKGGAGLMLPGAEPV